VKKQRPVYLNLTQIQLPAAGLSSILHRISGIIMFVAIGILIWLLDLSLRSHASFDMVVSMLKHDLFKFILWGILTAFIYHLVAGIRHMIMDAGYWEELSSGTLSAQVTIGISVVFSIMVGVWLWV
tara:strand:- start:9240 stop:9617 length:378 start_codon:yes stop_codon:yes gene_type:complete